VLPDPAGRAADTHGAGRARTLDPLRGGMHDRLCARRAAWLRDRRVPLRRDRRTHHRALPRRGRLLEGAGLVRHMGRMGHSVRRCDTLPLQGVDHLFRLHRLQHRHARRRLHHRARPALLPGLMAALQVRRADPDLHREESRPSFYPFHDPPDRRFRRRALPVLRGPMSLTAATGKIQTAAAALLALGMTVTVGTALGFQHIGGYIPCKLCLEQRLPYYIGIPVMVLALISALLRLPPLVTRGLLLAGALLMTWSVWLGAFHSGVEWGFWPGPGDCGVVAAPPAAGGSLLDQLDAVIPPSCDQAAGRFLGLSFAGWNTLASIVLAAIAWVAALKKN